MRRIIIVDDFYTNPDEVRQIALASNYYPKGTGTYPGQNSTSKFNPPGLFETVGAQIGVPVISAPNSAQGLFRIHFKNDTFQQFIHADAPADWGGVLYLNPNNQAQGGTAFWRHKETGLTHFPNEQKREQLGLSFDACHQKFNVVEGNKPELWELDFLCEAKYNRLVLFPAKCWHSHMPIEGFGTTKDDCRVVQLFFFNKKE